MNHFICPKKFSPFLALSQQPDIYCKLVDNDLGTSRLIY